MRVRHKQPTLVSMWMLDVFCCALGCVTLLFLLGARDAHREEQRNRRSLADLADTRKALDAATAERDDALGRVASAEADRTKLSAALAEAEASKTRLAGEVARLTGELASATADRDAAGKMLARARDEAKTAKALADATQAALTAAEAKANAGAKELAAARTQAADADDVLKKKQKEADALAKKLTDSAAAADELARLLRKRDDEKTVLVKQVTDLKKQLDDLDGRVLAARKEADDARTRVRDLTKKADDAAVAIVDLQGEKKKLADKYDKLQKDTEARFAGIVTTGKRVVFVVDISGSMAKKDTETADGTKWPLVVDTIGKVMRSVAGMEKYQVVIFSSTAKWLLGDGGWQDYDGEKSVTEVAKALLAVKPYDDTNLYAGLERAFELRPSGLDTVYLFSDGLPTSGPGLTLAQQTANPPLREGDKSEILGRHIRKTLTETWNRPAGGPRVKIHAVGFYFESPDVGAFLWALARENEGSFVGMSKP